MSTINSPQQNFDVQIERLSDETAKKVNLLIRSKAASMAPETPKELWNYIKIVHGREIPVTSVTEGNDIPMQWVWDFYTEKYPFMFAVGNRGGAKTYPAALITELKCRTRENYDAIHVAAVKKQAEVSSDYLKGFYNDPVLKDGFRKHPAKYSAEWTNNSSYKIVTGSMSGISGQHPAMLTLDEIEFWDIPALEQSFAVPQPKNGYNKLWCAFSTRQRSFGAAEYLTRLVREGEKDIKIYQWNIFETMQPCRSCDCIVGDRIDASKCNLWETCQGYKGLHCTGWVPVEEVRQLRATLDHRQWEVQYLCTRPSSHGIVLFNFEHEYCTLNSFDYGNYFRYTYDPALPLYVTHDPAEGNKSVAIFWQVVALSDSNYKIFVFDELIIPKCPNTLAMKQAVFEHCVKEGYGMPATVYVDPHKADSQADWRMGSPIGEGINRSFNADMPDMTTGYVLVEPGLGLLRGFLCDPGGKRHLYVHPEKCRGLVMAIKEHHYKLDNNNELGVEPKPDPAFKDEIDTLRYTVISVVTKMGKKIPGVSRSMKFISL